MEKVNLDEISNKIHTIEVEKGKRLLINFNLPNSLHLATYLFYGLKNIYLYLADIQFPEFFLSRAAIMNMASDTKPNMPDFYFIYDRNPLIISNLIKIFYFFTQGLLFKNCDNKDGIDTFILNEIKYINLNIFHFEDIVFYSHKLTETNVPLYAYASQNFFLTMAIGVQNDNYCLYINSLQKSYLFCNGNWTENHISNYLSNFCPYILLYQPHYFDEIAMVYSGVDICYKPLTFEFYKYHGDYFFNSKQYIQKLYNRMMANEMSFFEYLKVCLIFPAVFVAGTDYSFEKFGYMITVLFESDYSTKEKIINTCEDDELKKGAKELYIYYQKFLSFLRYIYLLAKSYIKKDSKNFIFAAKKTFSLLPIANASISSAFIDFINLLTDKISHEVDCEQNDFIQNSINTFLKCAINDGSEHKYCLKKVFDFSNNGVKLPTINVFQASLEIKKCYKIVRKKIGDDFKSCVRKINLKDHDKAKDYKFNQKLNEYILAMCSIYNDII